MNETKAPDPSPPLRRWAAGRLGIAPEADAGAARAALLRRLPGDDFVPPPDVHAAGRLVVGRPWGPVAEAAAFAADAGRLGPEVEAFAECFWSLPVPERRRRWRELSEACAGVP